MVFTSHAFLFYFLPAVLAVYYLLPQRFRAAFLALASYLFYGWWSPWFVTLMLASTLIDYSCGLVLGNASSPPSRRRAALSVSIVANLSLLGFFKYFLFATRNLNSLLDLLHLETLPVLDIVLPVGISFYTFQSMSYSIDLYRGDARPARSLADFAAYVALFPQLIAGPIIRYRQIADQLRARRHTLDKFARGIGCFVLGFAKKLLLANNLAPIADTVFAADAPPWHLAWVGVGAYALQIYFDFSGYSDMAIGLGRMLGFEFPENFRSPYRAESITDFWRRWHISLSTWLRDYLYIPLGGNRRGAARTYRNLAVTMLLGGLWHGAQWRFVAWGGLHGLLLAAERLAGKRAPWAVLPRAARVAVTFLLVLVTWVFFRAADLGEALRFLGGMLGVVPPTAASELAAASVYAPFPLAVLVLSALVTWGAPRTQELVDSPARRLSPVFAGALVALFVMSVLELSVQSHNPFLYFQF